MSAAEIADRLRPHGHTVDDEARRRYGDGYALSKIISDIHRTYDLFCQCYAPGSGAEFQIHDIIRKPGE